MNITNVPIQLIETLSNGRVYAKKSLGKLFCSTEQLIDEYIYTLKKFGLKFNLFFGNKYQIAKKINFLNYKKIYEIVKTGNILIQPIVKSTNQYLMEKLEKLKSGDVCLSECQEFGRGTYGKKWISPFGCNLYLSLYWNLHKKYLKNRKISLYVGIIIAEVLNKIIKKNEIKIKFPNDLFYKKKKLAGILIETINSNTDNNTVHIIIGIGINISMSINFKKKINQKWINLEQTGITEEKSIIAGKIILALRNWLKPYNKFGLSPMLNLKSLDVCKKLH